jgi:hypothetical protein
VSYRELKSGPGFSHQAVEMEALVGNDPTAYVLDTLRVRVREELGRQPLNPHQVSGAADPFGPPEPIHTNEVDPVSLDERRWHQEEKRQIGYEIERVLDMHVSQAGEAMEALRTLANKLVVEVPF